jgi:Tfp pilus assembly protein PilN
MNIQLNLLPEARLLRIKNQARRRRYAAIAGVTAGTIAATVIVFLLLQGFLFSTYQIGQGKIKELKKSLASTAEIEEKATTLQNNLAKFSEVNATRTNASKIFANLYDATPSNVTINSLSISSAGVVSITGTTGSYADVGTYSKSLQEYNVNYKPIPNIDRGAIFQDVQITSVSKGETENKTNFSIQFKINQELIKKQKAAS